MDEKESRKAGHRPGQGSPEGKLMEQSELRKLEAMCIQEEPPWCTATCPLHIDVRTFMAQAAKGQWNAARKTLERSMPPSRGSGPYL